MDTATRLTLILTALTVIGIGFSVPATYPWFIKWIFFVVGTLAALYFMFGHLLKDLWKKMFPKKIEVSGGWFKQRPQSQPHHFLPSLAEITQQTLAQVEAAELVGDAINIASPAAINPAYAEKQRYASFFFEDTDTLRPEFKRQLERFKVDLVGGISVRAIGYLTIQDGIHDVYLKHREKLPTDLRNKIVELHRGAQEFNAFARDCKTRTNQEIQKGIEAAREARRQLGEIFDEDFSGKPLEVNFVGVCGEEKTVKVIERLIQILDGINALDPRKGAR